jgi:S1-C subfamily serine protease
MSNNNNNIWELAEAYLAGTMSQEDFAKLKHRLATDTAFSADFYETTDLIRAMADNGKQKRFRTMLRDIQNKPQNTKKAVKAKHIVFTPEFWRTASVAAGVAILTSTITFWSLKPSINKTVSRYNTISREVTGLKIEQAKQLQKQKQLELDLDKAKKTAPPSDVKKTGTGFALTNNGYFVTAYHVIHDENGYGDSVYILNNNGHYFKAANDVAICIPCL